MFFPRNKKLLYLGLIILSVIFSQYLFAYDNLIVHPSLTEQMAKLYNLNFEEKLTQEEIEWLKKGSNEEDQVFGLGLFVRSSNHFYDPINKTGWTDENTLEILGLPSPKWAHDPIRQSTFVGGDYTWERALWDYSMGDKKHAYESLGHILHLIEDKAVPAHTRNDFHLTKDLGFPEPYEIWTMDQAKTRQLKFDFSEKLLSENKKPVIFDNLDSYFDNVAFYSNTRFFSQDTIYKYEYPLNNIIEGKEELSGGQIKEYVYGLDEHGNKFKLAKIIFINDKETGQKEKTYLLTEKTPEIHSDYWLRLAPKSILAGAGIIKLFKDEAGKIEQGKLVVRKPQVIGDFLIFTPMQYVASAIYNNTALAFQNTISQASSFTSSLTQTISSFLNNFISEAQKTFSNLNLLAFQKPVNNPSPSPNISSESNESNQGRVLSSATPPQNNPSQNNSQSSSQSPQVSEQYDSPNYQTEGSSASSSSTTSPSNSSSSANSPTSSSSSSLSSSSSSLSSSPDLIYNARFYARSQDLALEPGSAVTISAQFKNTGTATWKRSNVFLNAANSQSSLFYYSTWLSQKRPTGVDQEEVKPGQFGGFTFPIKAPQDQGNYLLSFRPVWQDDNGFHWLGSDYVSFKITIKKLEEILPKPQEQTPPESLQPQTPTPESSSSPTPNPPSEQAPPPQTPQTPESPQTPPSGGSSSGSSGTSGSSPASSPSDNSNENDQSQEPPIPQIILDSLPSALSNQTTAAFSFHTQEENTAFSCRLDQNQFQDCSSSFTIDNLLEGEHTFQIKVSKVKNRLVNSQNAENQKIQFSWKIDLTPPQKITDLAAEISSLEQNSVILSWSNLNEEVQYLIGLSNVEISQQNWNESQKLNEPQEIKDGKSQITLKNLKQNTPYWFALKAKDKAGNFSELSNIVSFEIKKEPLKILISEIKAEGNAAGDEFIELYNPGPDEINLEGWHLEYGALGGKRWTKKYFDKNLRDEKNKITEFFDQIIFPPRHYLLITSKKDEKGYQGQTQPDMVAITKSENSPTNLSLNQEKGIIKLVDDSNQIIDAVAWEFKKSQLAAENDDSDQQIIEPIEGEPITQQNLEDQGWQWGSLERKANIDSNSETLANGKDKYLGSSFDTENNLSDFVLRTISDPQNLQSFPEPRFAPEKINDLEAKLEPGKIILSWTAPNDPDSLPENLRYEIFYSAQEFDETKIDQAVKLPNPPQAQEPGKTQTIQIAQENFLAGTSYYFALRTIDQTEISSPLSNTAFLLIPKPIPNLEWPEKLLVVPQMCPDDQESQAHSFFSDGQGGVILFWRCNDLYDYISSDLYAQRISKEGELLWSKPLEVAKGIWESGFTSISPWVSDGQNGFYYTWTDPGNIGKDGKKKFGVLHLSGNGQKLWQNYFSLPIGFEYRQWFVSNGKGGLYIISRRHSRDNDSEKWINIQHINSEAEIIDSGFDLRIEEDEHIYQVVSGSEGSFVVILQSQEKNISFYWFKEEDSTFKNISYSKIALTERLRQLEAISDSQGSLMAVWTESDSSSNSYKPFNIYFQYFTSQGNPQFNQPILIKQTLPAFSIELSKIVLNNGDDDDDDNDNDSVSFIWYEDVSENRGVYAQRVNIRTGEKLWQGQGVVIDHASSLPDPNDFSAHIYPWAISSASEGNYITWDRWAYPDYGFWVQYLDKNGKKIWGENGFWLDKTGYGSEIFSDRREGAIATWLDWNPDHKKGVMDYKIGIWAQRISR